MQRFVRHSGRSRHHPVGEMRDRAPRSTSPSRRRNRPSGVQHGAHHRRPRTIARLVSVFDAAEQAGKRLRLSESLRAVVSQRCLPRKDGKGRVVAVEVMRKHSHHRRLHRQHREDGEIRDPIAQGRVQYGMQTFDRHTDGTVHHRPAVARGRRGAADESGGLREESGVSVVIRESVGTVSRKPSAVSRQLSDTCTANHFGVYAIDGWRLAADYSSDTACTAHQRTTNSACPSVRRPSSHATRYRPGSPAGTAVPSYWL